MTLNKGLKNQMSWYEARCLLNIFFTRESDFMIFLHGNIRTG